MVKVRPSAISGGALRTLDLAPIPALAVPPFAPGLVVGASENGNKACSRLQRTRRLGLPRTDLGATAPEVEVPIPKPAKFVHMGRHRMQKGCISVYGRLQDGIEDLYLQYFNDLHGAKLHVYSAAPRLLDAESVSIGNGWSHLHGSQRRRIASPQYRCFRSRIFDEVKTRWVPARAGAHNWSCIKF